MLTGSEFQNQDIQPERAPENLAIDGLRMTPVKFAVIYAVVGALWVGLTDLIVTLFFGGEVLLAQTLKGFLYVGTTTALVYWLARRALLEVRCKWTESQLKETQNILEITLASLGDAVFLINPADRTIVQCNPAAERLFGYTAKEMIGRNTQFLYEQRKAYENFCRESEHVLEQGETFRSEFKMQAKNGDVIQTEHTITAVDKELGWRQGVISIIHDITERKEAENALRQSEERFRALFENSPDAVFLTNPDGRIEAANPAACAMFGWSAQEFRNLTRSAVLDADDPRLAKGLEERRRAGIVSGVELTAISKDGTRFPVEVDSVILSQDVKKSFVIMRDVSRRKKEEQETLELERQLYQAQKMDSVGRLAGGIAHDFNNMLSVILGNTELAMLSAEGSSQLHDYLQETLNAAKRSADLTRQLLAFARKQTIDPKVLNLNDAITGMLKMVGRMLREDISLTWQPTINPWPVKMDPAQINQILVNLVVNARDAISGFGKITLETHNVELNGDDCKQRPGCRPGRYVRLTVADDGEGMDEETRTQIFEPFFTTKSPDEGTGLGLATVYGIIKQNEGFIYVESEPGQGCAFQIYLPPVEASEIADDDEATAEKLAMGNETILLVEDEIPLLTLVRQLLEELGYKVLAASKPSEALAMTKDYPGPIHLLMTDIVMPDMNGRELRDGIGKKRPDLKCLFMSGHTADIISQRGVLDEGLNFLQKPFSIGDLAAKLRLVLEA